VTAASAATEDQSAQLALLADPALHGGQKPRRIDTHGAVVFLAGDRAFKLKRAVRFSFLDYSTAERRRAATAAELAINRRTAPDLYLGVRPIFSCPGGGLRLGALGEGAVQEGAVDWVLEMRRFDDDALLDRRARDGRLDEATALALADAIAAFHDAAARRPEHGGHDAMARIVQGVLAGLAADGASRDPARLARLGDGLRARLARDRVLLDVRRDQGYVRHGHGDLHLGNVCLWRGRPTLFDAIEFDEAIACGDVLYDFAFVLMDLMHRGLDTLANAAFNRYFARALGVDGIANLAGLGLLPLFLSCRAAIRCRVGLAAASAQPDEAQAGAKRAEAATYLDLALDCLHPPPPRLIAIGGLSGTGKSTLAHALAPRIGARPGALVLRSDVLRKALSGCDLFQRLPQSAYDPAFTERVFDELARGAGTALAAGHAVIADAVYLSPGQRAAIAAAARQAGVPFAGLWLDAPAPLLERRVMERRNDVSDAGVAIVRAQAGVDPGPLDWIRIDAGGSPAQVAAQARAALALSKG
jgi:aminoglycoside phosphotransferase family enzyme/predicted kinase